MILKRGAMMINNRTDTTFDLTDVGYGIGSVDGVAKRAGDTPSATPRSTTTMVRWGELLDRGDVPSTRESDFGIGNQEPDKDALELCRAPMRNRIAHIRPHFVLRFFARFRHPAPSTTPGQ